VRLPIIAIFQYPTIEQLAKATKTAPRSHISHASRAESSFEPEYVTGNQPTRAPLTFSQQAHWAAYQLDQQPSLRQVASATRLKGPLVIAALSSALEKTIERHLALRTRIVRTSEEPLQAILPASNCALSIESLDDLNEQSRDEAVANRIERFIFTPIDVTTEPLFAAKVLKLDHEDHVLILALDHLIADAQSMGILFRDLLSYYVQIIGHDSAPPAPLPMSFAEYATQQRRTQAQWCNEHLSYWREHLCGCERVPFPPDPAAATNETGWRILQFQIDASFASEWRQWCRQMRTSLPLSALTAYGMLVLRWCGVRDTVIQYQTHGRAIAEVENSIGYFACPLNLRIQYAETATCIDLLEAITQEYRNGQEHADFSYLEAQSPRPAFTRNTGFNWIPKEADPDSWHTLGRAAGLECIPIRFANPIFPQLQRDTEPFLQLLDTGRDIIGSVHFPVSRFSAATMERFGRNFLTCVDVMLKQPRKHVKDISLPD
jgi:hypothetical protein